MIQKTFTYVAEKLTTINDKKIILTIEDSIFRTINDDIEIISAYAGYAKLIKVAIIDDQIKVIMRLSYDLKLGDVCNLKSLILEDIEEVVYF